MLIFSCMLLAFFKKMISDLPKFVGYFRSNAKNSSVYQTIRVAPTCGVKLSFSNKNKIPKTKVNIKLRYATSLMHKFC